MRYIFLYILVICYTANAANIKRIDKKISLNKKILHKKKKQEEIATTKIKSLAKQIQQQESIYNNIEKGGLPFIVFTSKDFPNLRGLDKKL